jgi:hypothetical protein
MDLKPSTYYLDRIKSFSSELAESQAQQQKATLEQQQQTEKAAQAVAEAEQKKKEERTRFAKELYSQGFGETMWGQHRDIVQRMREGMNEHLDQYISNPALFYQDLNQMKSFIDSSEDYYRRTSKSAEEAFVRTTPGANNPFERDGFMDTNTVDFYKEAMRSIDATTSVSFFPGRITVDDKPIEEYMSMFTQDLFAPKLGALPVFSAEDIFQRNVGAFNPKNRDQWPVVANKIIDDYLNKSPQRILGLPSDDESGTSFSARSKDRREELVNGVLKIAQGNK